MGLLDKVLGFVFLPVLVVVDHWPARPLISGILVGSYANLILYTLELVAVIRYYKRNQDSRLFHAMIFFTFVVDTASTISTCTCVYSVCNQSRLFSILSLMSPFLAACHHPLGYDSYRFSFFLTGYQCSRSVTGDVNFLPKQLWADTVSFVTYTISATIVRCFLIFRYWRLSVIFVLTSMSAVQTTLWCLGAKTITSHLYWSFAYSHPCVNPILCL